MDEPVYVDRDMWEKVVLNLLSNALKFTFDGSISITGRPRRQRSGGHRQRHRDRRSRRGDAAAVRTIPSHRNVRPRSNEGSGIGSGAGEGVGRTARRQHHRRQRRRCAAPRSPSVCRSARRICPSTWSPRRRQPGGLRRSPPYVQEALRWMPGDAGESATLSPPYRADRREHRCRRLRRPARHVACPGRRRQHRHARLLGTAAARRRLRCRRRHRRPAGVCERSAPTVPDLVISDVMMPRLDGLALVAALR